MPRAKKKEAEVEIENDDDTVSTAAEDDDETIVAEEEDDNHEDEEKKAAASAEETVEELKARLQKSNEDLAAEREANRKKDEELRKASTRASNSESENVRIYETRLTESIASTTDKLDSLERDMERALDEGDNKAYVKAQRELAKQTNYLSRLENDKERLDAWKEEREGQMASGGNGGEDSDGLTPASRDWIKRHPEFNTDSRYRAIALAAHNLAQAEGVRMDSPEYFSRIEKELDERYYKRDASASSASSTSARPTRETGGSTGGSGPQRVRLTADELEVAASMDMTPKEYAKYKLQLQRDGRMGNPRQNTSAI